MPPVAAVAPVEHPAGREVARRFAATSCRTARLDLSAWRPRTHGRRASRPCARSPRWPRGDERADGDQQRTEALPSPRRLERRRRRRRRRRPRPGAGRLRLVAAAAVAGAARARARRPAPGSARSRPGRSAGRPRAAAPSRACRRSARRSSCSTRRVMRSSCSSISSTRSTPARFIPSSAVICWMRRSRSTSSWEYRRVPLGERLRRDQPALLVHAQRLRVHVGQLGGDGDHEDAAAAVDRRGDRRAAPAGRAHPRAPADAAASRRTRSRGLPFSTRARSSTSSCCSLVSSAGTSMTKR